ncbi:bax inhibitor family protein [Moniliophthora roreri MCA 2997]|uniref:Bax inhibitor family protein n=1 Tax=Moniliophthora roreri (strain MCA 2997) TaxID=1381753 RepID=V2WRC1_MONRO|nr:bax inhibitor family protein [Moniliophthora roreri MCA 2997]
MKNVRFGAKFLRIMVLGLGCLRLVSWVLLLKVGIASRAIKAHHWRFAGASLIAIARTMFAITDTPLRYHNISQKHLLWARASNASQAIAFTPLYFLSPAIISRGALYTLATLASTTWCNMTATTSADPELGN